MSCKVGAAGDGTAGSQEPPRAVEWTRHDSAGIQIVVSPWRPPPSAPLWRLTSEPTLRIGGVDGPPLNELFDARGAIRLSNGYIVVANRGTRELRFFGSTGTSLFASGGKGQGAQIVYLEVVRTADSALTMQFGQYGIGPVGAVTWARERMATAWRWP